MWNAPNPHPSGPPTSNQPHEQHPVGAPKWAQAQPQAVKEEPKNNIPLPEILENSSGSPHVVNQTSSPSSQHIGGYGSPGGGTPTPSSQSATLAAAVAAGFSDVVFTSSNVSSVNNQDHLIYDSIGMSQVQNYSPSLSSSLGKSSYLT